MQTSKAVGSSLQHEQLQQVNQGRRDVEKTPQQVCVMSETWQESQVRKAAVIG